MYVRNLHYVRNFVIKILFNSMKEKLNIEHSEIFSKICGILFNIPSNIKGWYYIINCNDQNTVYISYFNFLTNRKTINVHIMIP